MNPDHRYMFAPGAMVHVKHCTQSYPAPSGLEPGDRVQVLRFAGGHYSVEGDGRTFSIFMTNIVESRPSVSERKGSATASRRAITAGRHMKLALDIGVDGDMI